MRVAIVSNITAPYRADLFRYAAKEFDYLKVYFQAFIERNRSWEEFPSLPYEHEYLRHRGIRIGNRFLGLYIDIQSRLMVDRPDVVVSYGFSTATIGCAAFCGREGVPLVIANDGTPETDPLNGPEAWYRRALIRRCQGFVAASSSAAEYFRLLGADPARITVVSLSSDLLDLSESVSRRRGSATFEEGVAQRGPAVCFPTRLVKNKRILDACSAVLMNAELFPNIRLRIAGSGPLLGTLERWIQSNAPSRIEMTGMLNWPQMIDLYATSDILLFTGTRERYGMVILEALAAGIPVVAYSKSGAAVDLIDEGVNGFRVEEGDVRGLAHALGRVARDATTYQRMSESAARSAERHDVRLKAREFAAALKGAAGARLFGWGPASSLMHS